MLNDTNKQASKDMHEHANKDARMQKKKSKGTKRGGTKQAS